MDNKQNKKITTNPQSSNKNILVTAIKIVIWFGLLYASTYVNLHSLFVIISGIAYIFMNLGQRKPGQMSAYSKAAGSMDPDEMLLGTSKSVKKQQRIFGQQQQVLAEKIDEYFKYQSKYGNKPCYCQSGLKFKKCCLLKKRNQQSQKKKQL